MGETRGNADFAVHLEDANGFQFDMSFQAGTFKFAISRSYWTDTSKANIASVLAWQDDFMKLQEAFPEYKRLNRAKSRARLSICKNLKEENKEWYLMDRATFAQIVRHEFEMAAIMRQRVIDIHEERLALR